MAVTTPKPVAVSKTVGSLKIKMGAEEVKLLIQFTCEYSAITQLQCLKFDPSSNGTPHTTRLAQNFKGIGITLWTYLTPPLFLLALADFSF